MGDLAVLLLMLASFFTTIPNWLLKFVELLTAASLLWGRRLATLPRSAYFRVDARFCSMTTSGWGLRVRIEKDAVFALLCYSRGMIRPFELAGKVKSWPSSPRVDNLRGVVGGTIVIDLLTEQRQCGLVIVECSYKWRARHNEWLPMRKRERCCSSARRDERQGKFSTGRRLRESRHPCLLPSVGTHLSLLLT